MNASDVPAVAADRGRSLGRALAHDGRERLRLRHHGVRVAGCGRDLGGAAALERRRHRDGARFREPVRVERRRGRDLARRPRHGERGECRRERRSARHGAALRAPHGGRARSPSRACSIRSCATAAPPASRRRPTGSRSSIATARPTRSATSWCAASAAGVWSEPVQAGPDHWQIEGCPVNGPAIAARGANVAVAWFTAPDNRSRVRFAASTDGAASFAPAVDVDTRRAVRPRGRRARGRSNRVRQLVAAGAGGGSQLAVRQRRFRWHAGTVAGGRRRAHRAIPTTFRRSRRPATSCCSHGRIRATCRR